MAVTPSSFSLGPRGKRLWDDMNAQYAFDPVQRELLVEACRTVDELENLASLLRGDQSAWLKFRLPRNLGTDAEIVLEVSKVEETIRALRTTLKNITSTLTVAGKGAERPEEDKADELQKRREERKREREARLADRGRGAVREPNS